MGLFTSWSPLCYYCLVTGQLGGKGALKAATGTQAPGNQQLGSTSARVKLSPHSCPKLVLFKVSLHHSSRHPLQNIQNHGRLNPERRREPPCPPPCVTSEGLMGQNSFPRLSAEDRLQVRNLDRLSVPGVLSHLGHISIQPTLNFSLIVCQLRCWFVWGQDDKELTFQKYCDQLLTLFLYINHLPNNSDSPWVQPVCQIWRRLCDAGFQDHASFC